VAKNIRSLTVLGVILIVSATLIYSRQIQPPSKVGYGDITVEQAKELIERKSSLVILDVRTEWEFESEHIEGAINIPVDELQQRLGELNPNDEILVYCRTGNRSARATQTLKDNGYSKVYHMADGIEAWKQAGYLTMK